MNATLKLFGKTYKLTPQQDLVAIPIMLILLIVFTVFAILGTYKFGGQIAVLVAAVCLLSIKLNDTEYAVIKNETIRKTVNWIAGISAILFYFFG